MEISIKDLTFPDLPSKGYLKAASNLLNLLGALNEKEEITDFGQSVI